MTIKSLGVAASLIGLTAFALTSGSIYGNEELQKATFAGGCFWCMEPPFEKLDGVKSVVSGYTGGEKANPTYKAVSAGATKHLEAVEVTYDPSVVSFAQLLHVFWRQIDPTDAGGQFADRGNQYRTAIFFHNEDEKILAEASRQQLSQSGRFDRPIVTEIVPAGPFYVAEEYHQDYYKKNPTHYKRYRVGSGREQYLQRVWGNETSTTTRANGSWESFSKPSRGELEKILTPLQFHVTQDEGTEPPYRNDYWNSKEVGIYVDVVSGEPLFSSTDKYDSGTGWPSFTRPLRSANIVKKEDRQLGMVRTEVRSKHGDSHLGHLFPDGPKPTGLRYCINSAALRFIPLADLETAGYGEYRSPFEN